MKSDLMQYPVLAEFLGVNKEDPNGSMLSVIVKEIKDSYIELGVCKADDCTGKDAPEVINKAMNVLAIVYDSLKGVLREQEFMI